MAHLEDPQHSALSHDHSQEMGGEDGNEANSQLLELQDAFVQTLSASGALGKIRAELRATALSLLRADPSMKLAAVGATHSLVDMPLESQVTLLLVDDFLRQKSYRQSAGVYSAEAGPGFASDEAHDVLRERFYSESRAEGSRSDETLLERIVKAALTTPPNPQSERPPPTGTVAPPQVAGPSAAFLPANDVGHNEQGSADSSPMPHSGTLDNQSDAVLQDAGVQHYLEHYEESLPFSDSDRAFSGDDFDEIEIL